MTTAFSGVFAALGILAFEAGATETTSQETLAHFDASLQKALEAYGPLFSKYIPRSSTEAPAPGDFVKVFQGPDGSDVRVLVKAPAPAQPGKILRFAPIAPGQDANEYFARATQKAISGGYAALILPKAIYNFSAPPVNSPGHWLIQGARDLTIDGQGSTLNFASPLVAGVTIGGSQRVIFRNFDVDWPNELMASVATIASTDQARHTMTIKVAPQYQVNAKTHIVALSLWDARSDPKNPHLALKDYREQYTNNQGTMYLGDNNFQIPYWNFHLKVGDVIMVRHWGRDPWKNAIQTGGSYNLDFENVHVYSSPYLGFLLSGGGGYRLSHCSVTRLNAARLVSSEADAVHIADNTGDIIIEDSTFGYQGDDGINIHGAVGSFEREADGSLHWTAGGESSYAPYGWNAGTDTLGFFDGTFGFLGSARLQSRANQKAGLSLTMKDAAPQAATQLADLSRVSGRFVIRNNQFMFNRERGLFVQSSHGLVEKNAFTGQTAHAIVAGDGYGEGPGVQNVIFRGNRFSNVGSFPTVASTPNLDAAQGAIVVAVIQNRENVDALTPVHAGLIFDANKFSDLQGPGLFISRANGVVVVNNEFKNTNLLRIPNADPNLNGSIVITHAHNVYLANNPMEGAGPVWIDPVSTDRIIRARAQDAAAGASGGAPLASPTMSGPGSASGIRVRVGVPYVARGPGAIADSWFTEARLPDGRFRGFTALGSTLAIDGKEPYSMGGPAKTVLNPGAAGSPSSCGEWIQHVELAGKTLIGWVHNETACNYAKGQTHASMTLATSSDYGLTWKIEGPIITGPDPSAAGKNTGDSCPTVIKDKDGFYYAYCLRNGGQSWNGGYTFLARAPVAQPGPGNWKKFYKGSFSEPGVGGLSSPVDALAVGYWSSADKTIAVKWKGAGIGISLSQDRIHFIDPFPGPLMPAEPGDWSRRNGLELVAYHDLIDAKTGLNVLGDHWLMVYMYLKPKEGFDKRYLVFRPVDIWASRKGDELASGVMLAHWYDAAHHDHVSTIAPLPGNWSTYRLIEQSGYLMPAPEATRKTVALEECVSKWPGHPDHILIEKGVCETQDYERVRAAGFAFASQEPNTQPLYRCYSDAEKSHFASNREDCGQLGRREALLGFVLKD